MSYALRAGCNLFDTSANYMRGESEALIGKVLKEDGQRDAFVITKSGYDEREGLDADVTRDLLHPDFLETRLRLSLERLQSRVIDGFLLHSPETSMKSTADEATSEGFYERIRTAFEFLEDRVANGTIRYYGISSNTFHLSTENRDTIRVQRLLAIAEHVATTHHFRLIEFPFNLVEQDALTRHHGGASLIELARANKLVTIGNRPLNAKGPAGALRLALAVDYERALEFEGSSDVFEECMSLVKQQLGKRGLSDDPRDYAIVSFLSDNWMTVGNPDAVNELFAHLHRFLDTLYEGEIPTADLDAYRRFYYQAVACAKRVMAARTIAFKEEMISKGVLDRNDTRPLALISCEKYLNSGLDHVVVGMRRREYVDTLKPLFGRVWTSA